MDKYTIAPPAGSTNNSVGAADRPWHEGHFDSVKLNGGDLGEYLAESTGYGIVSGCEPSINGLTVTVGAGVLHLADGTRKEMEQTNITLAPADSTNPRIDLVYIDSTGAVAKVTGTAAADPSPKMLPTNAIGICIVNVKANATTGVITLNKDTSLQDSYSWVPQFRRTELSCSDQQDAAYYNGKLFSGVAEAGTLVVTNVETNTNVATITLPGNIKPHCNTICFGEKQSPNDEYPLIYLTGYNGKYSDDTNLPKGTCFVYKINSDYSARLIRSIYIGFIADDLWKVGTGNRPVVIGKIDYGNFVVDTDRKKLIVFTCTTTNPCTRFFEFALPTATGTVNLTTTDVEQYWDAPLLSWPQGTVYKDGKIYVAHGYEEKTSSIDVVDLGRRSLISHITMGDFTNEGEGVFFINDRLFVRGATKYWEVINYKKINTTGKLSKLKTTKSNNLVDAINDATTNGLGLQSFNDGPAGVLKHVIITCKEDENGDLYTPIVEQINVVKDDDSITNVFLFEGLVSKNDGTDFSYVKGYYRTGNSFLHFVKYPWRRDRQAIIYEYLNETPGTVEKYSANYANELKDCRTTNFIHDGDSETLYITVTNNWVSILCHGLIGKNNIMRQYILGNNSVNAYKFDYNSDNLITITAVGTGNKYSITNAESTRYMLESSGPIIISKD